MLGSAESEMVRLISREIPVNESFMVWNFRSRERKFLGAKVP